MPVPSAPTRMVDREVALPVLLALANDTRPLILRLLAHDVMNVSELTCALGLHNATVFFHLKKLEQAGLLHVECALGKRSLQKLVSKRYDALHLNLPGIASEAGNGLPHPKMPLIGPLPEHIRR